MIVTCHCGRKTEYEFEADPANPYAHCECGASHQVHPDECQTEPCIRTAVTMWEKTS